MWVGGEMLSICLPYTPLAGNLIFTFSFLIFGGHWLPRSRVECINGLSNLQPTPTILVHLWLKPTTHVLARTSQKYSQPLLEKLQRICLFWSFWPLMLIIGILEIKLEIVAHTCIPALQKPRKEDFLEPHSELVCYCGYRGKPYLKIR